MLDIIERFGQLSIGYLIMTKLDETTAFRLALQRLPPDGQAAVVRHQWSKRPRRH